MREKTFGFLMLILILTSSLMAAFTVRPSLAQNGVDNGATSALSNDLNNASQASIAPKTVNSSVSYDGFNAWDFNDSSVWSKSAYLDGNKTRLIVGIKDQKLGYLSQLEEIAVKRQARIVNTVSMGGKPVAVVVELLLTSVTGFVDDVQGAGWASYVEPNMKVQCQFVPNDPYWSLQWGPQKIQTDWAWNTTVGNSSLLVAVVDTGIDYNHPDLAPNYVPLGYDWVNYDPDPLDDFGHGTHCAGIIAAALNNSIGIAGLAQVHLMAEKVLDSWGSGYWDWAAEGIIHAADSGARIISMSFGGYGESELLHDAIKYAYDDGVLLVAAAGNDNTNSRSYPAGFSEVVAVAATDESDNKAWFSNWGDWIELAAPGANIYSTMPTYPVTLNYDYGYPMNYTSLSGTSMACPCVVGVAALVWSLHPDKSRDWVRLWLRYTADDLGASGFDVYYGYGRINARKAVEETPPAHELIASDWTTPRYVEPGSWATINATILNFGENDESNVMVQLLANGSIVDSTTVDFLANGNMATVSLNWNPTVVGSYNVTLYVVPVPGETSVENNVLSKVIYVGHPVKVVVLRSAGNIMDQIITNWQVLTDEWYHFGDTMVDIDYTSLNKDSITYQDLAASGADVLVISCAYDRYMGWEYTDAEIAAITQYVHKGHGLIVTAGTLYSGVPNNNKLAPLLGISDEISWTSTSTDLMDLTNTTHPFFNKVPDPLVFPPVGTAIPYSGVWDQSKLAGGKYLALGHFQESAVVTFRGLVYISAWLEVIPAYYKHHLQLLYNAMLYSRYQKPEHELVVTLDAQRCVNPHEYTLLNATVANEGLSDETNVTLQLFIDGTSVSSVIIPDLPVSSSYTLNYPWIQSVQGVYNVTVYAPPVSGEGFAGNNIAEQDVLVLLIIVKNCLVYSDDYVVAPSARYVITALDNLGINYTYYADDPWGFGAALQSQTWDLVVVDHCNYYSVGNFWPQLDEYVHNGGLLVLSTFDIDGSDSVPTNLWGTMGVQWISDMFYPEPVYRWVPQHSIFTFPNVVGNLTSFTYDYSDEGDHVAVTTGTAVGGFTEVPSDGYAGIVVGNAYRTVLFSFILDEFRSAESWSGKIDAMKLWENAIAYLAEAHEHDVAVSLEAPAHVNPGAATLVNSTVSNRGINDETNVELQLLINDMVVNDVLIPSLSSGASFNMSYAWTPTEGTYNVTAYAAPVPNEGYTEDNVATKIVSVFQAKGCVLFDQTHSTDNVASYSIWVSDLMDRGYEVDYHMFGPITADTLKGYDALVIPQSRADYTYDELNAIQSFVLDGGGLLVIGDEYPYYYNDLTSFAGVGWDYGGGGGWTSHIVPHPVTEGVSIVYFANSWSYVYASFPAVVVIRDAGTDGMVAVSEIGSGRVIGLATEELVVDWCIGFGDNSRLANNMIDWLSAPESPTPIAFFRYSPASPVVGEIVMFNALGSTSNDGAIVSYSWEFGDSSNTTTASPVITYAYSSGGTYNVTLTVMNGVGLSDSTSQTLTVYVQVRFDAVGVSSDFTGTVLSVDGVDYGVARVPMTFAWEFGGTHTFAYDSPLVVGAAEYLWNSTAGLSTQQSGSITVTYPGSVTGYYVTSIHDVAVTNITMHTMYDCPYVYQGLSANITITVSNNGNFSENVNVSLYYNITANEIVGTQDTTLLAGENETLMFVWNTVGVPYCHNYTLTAVATIPLDYTPTDNTLSVGNVEVSIMGDLNGDSKVDIRDISLAARAFSSTPGTTRWRPDADITGPNGVPDGKVDIRDIALIAKNFGRTAIGP